jgi:DNA-binding LytR/AlgR family response regulator
MSIIKIGIVEDEALIAHNISHTLSQLGYNVTEPVDNYTDAVKMMKSEKPDLMLLDVQLAGEKDGIDVAHYIRKNENIPFIFLTANSDALTVERAKEVNPPAYIVKPFNKEDLYTSIEIALSNHNRKTPLRPEQKTDFGDAIFVKDGYVFRKILFDDILFFYSEHVYVNVETVDGKQHVVRTSLKDYLKHFDPEKFIHANRRYVVNIRHIDQVHTYKLIMKNKEVDLDKDYREELFKRLKLS